MYKNAQSNFIHNRQKMETTQKPTNKRKES